MNSTRPAESRSTSSFLSFARSASASGLFSWWRMRVRLSRLETVTPVSIPAICGKLASAAKRPGRLLAQNAERLLQRGASGSGTRVRTVCARAGDQRLDVIEVVGDQQAGERQVGERRIAGPGAQHARDAAVLEPRAVGRHDVIHAAHDDRDVRCLFAAAERAQVAEVTKITVDPLARPAKARASAAGAPRPATLRRFLHRAR